MVGAAATHVLHHVEQSTINVGCNARAAALSLGCLWVIATDIKAIDWKAITWTSVHTTLLYRRRRNRTPDGIRYASTIYYH